VHDTAMEHGKLFFDAYVADGAALTIVDIGSQDVNGSLRSVAPAGSKYVGIDFAKGNGVDVVISDPYLLPFGDETVDVCVSSSCFEHSEFFWLVFLEALRILKPAGLLYVNVPSNGSVHRYPVDCWRFYPDSGLALQNWARRNGFPTVLIESFIGNHGKDGFNDFVGVFLKDEAYREQYPRRIQTGYRQFTNGRSIDSDGVASLSAGLEDEQPILTLLKRKIRHLLTVPS
jgi:SAM-dependent methyltransferase